MFHVSFTKYLLKCQNKKIMFVSRLRTCALPTSRMVVVMVVVVQVTQGRSSPAVVLQMQGFVV